MTEEWKVCYISQIGNTFEASNLGKKWRFIPKFSKSGWKNCKKFRPVFVFKKMFCIFAKKNCCC